MLVWVASCDRVACWGDELAEPPLPATASALFRANDVDEVFRPAQFQPRGAVELSVGTGTDSTSAGRAAISFGSRAAASALLDDSRGSRAVGSGADIVLGIEAKARVTTDAGNLLGKSPSALNISAQQRNPVTTETRVRGEGVGQLLASGSYWLPARMDLDTMLSKLDSRIVLDMMVIKGPYNSRFGPGFSFVDIALLPAPRYANGHQTAGYTSFDFKSNGEQWYGRTSVSGGDNNWGYRIEYGHRTGNDYRTGAGGGQGFKIPASYNSRDWDLALGWDLDADSTLEFSYLRLDQTSVEYPGYVYDMDFLVTDGFELVYTKENQQHFDRMTVETWYNQTRFTGNAQGLTKRQQIPELTAAVGTLAFTAADVSSTGFSAATSWGEPQARMFTLGTDLRIVKQELVEFNNLSGALERSGFIPKSAWINPGIFLERVVNPTDRLQVTAGARVDWLATNANGADSGGEVFRDREFTMWSAFLTSACEASSTTTVNAGVGFATRPPQLAELYADRATISMLQHGINLTIGDQNLDEAQRLQADLGFVTQRDYFVGGLNGFYSWTWDFITYDGGAGDTFVFTNTNLATIWGVEAFAEWDASNSATLFATLSYVEGDDRDFNNEPLPSIPPLESRLGVRLHEESEVPVWSVEFSARLVAAQNRVAADLLERATSGFAVFDLRGYWNVTDRMILIGGVENLTDRFYREHLDIRSGIGVFRPGMNAYVGSELSY